MQIYCSDHGFGIVALRCVEFIDDSDNVLDYVKQTFHYCKSLNEQQRKEMGIKLVPSVFVCMEKTREDFRNSKQMSMPVFISCMHIFGLI